MKPINGYENVWDDIDSKIWHCVRSSTVLNGNGQFFRDNVWNNVGDVVRINIYVNTTVNVKNSVIDNFLRMPPPRKQLIDSYNDAYSIVSKI